jgi:hypothetical protein
MPAKNDDLHGSAPDKCETALLIVDLINDLDFPESDQLLRYAPAMARKTREVKTAGKARRRSRYLRE